MTAEALVFRPLLLAQKPDLDQIGDHPLPSFHEPTDAARTNGHRVPRRRDLRAAGAAVDVATLYAEPRSETDGPVGGALRGFLSLLLRELEKCESHPRRSGDVERLRQTT